MQLNGRTKWRRISMGFSGKRRNFNLALYESINQSYFENRKREKLLGWVFFPILTDLKMHKESYTRENVITQKENQCATGIDFLREGIVFLVAPHWIDAVN